LDYLGQTALDVNDIYDFGMSNWWKSLIVGTSLITGARKYHFIRNNCQKWVENFLKKVCPNAEIDKTIEEVLFLPPK
jgi:hypothetical protein